MHSIINLCIQILLSRKMQPIYKSKLFEKCYQKIDLKTYHYVYHITRISLSILSRKLISNQNV